MKRPHGHQRSRHLNIFLAIVAVAAAAGIAWSVVEVKAHSRVDGGWMNGRSGEGHGFARVCADDREAAVAGLITYGERVLDITTAQKAAWQAFADGVREGGARFDAICDELNITADRRNAPQALALAETAMAAVLDALREIRPAFEDLYAVLNTDQRERLDGLIARHRRP